LFNRLAIAYRDKKLWCLCAFSCAPRIRHVGQFVGGASHINGIEIFWSFMTAEAI
jgi:hypothetical protein